MVRRASEGPGIWFSCAYIHAAINLRRVDADYFDRMVCEQFDGERGLARCRRAHQAHGVW